MNLKKRIIIACALVAFVGVAVTCTILFAPIPMNIDWDSLYEIGTNVEVLQPGAEGNPSADSVALVKKNEDGTIDASDWKLLQFTDMHLSESNKDKWGGNDRTMKEYIAAIQREKPDFVVLTGDIITSIGARARAVQFCEVMERLGIYWAYNLGNHEGDAFYKLPRKDLMAIIEQYPHCLSEGSVKRTKATGEEVWGVGNFVVNLLGAENKVVQSLIFMDSGDAISNADAKKFNVKKGSYDYLKESQMQWYKEQVLSVTDNLTNGVKTMLFIHIPLVEQANLSYIDLKKDSDPRKAGWTEDAPLAGWTYLEGAIAKNYDGELVGRVALKDGWNVIDGTVNFEGVACSKYNNGMYALMKEMRAGVNALFCGHDHINNSILYETPQNEETPLYLAYGYCSGYSTYNLYKSKKTDDPNNLMKGYSIITVHGNGAFDYAGVSYDRNYEMTLYIENSLPKQN